MERAVQVICVAFCISVGQEISCTTAECVAMTTAGHWLYHSRAACILCRGGQLSFQNVGGWGKGVRYSTLTKVQGAKAHLGGQRPLPPQV